MIEPAAQDPCERGAGVLSTVFGVAIMLALLAVATHVAVGLWARTATESIAYDAAREVATAPTDDQGVRAKAIERAMARLGGHSERVSLEFDDAGPDIVVLHVTSEPTGLMPRLAGSAGIVGELRRTIRIRREKVD